MSEVLFRIDRWLEDRPPGQIAADLKLSTRTVERWIADGLTWEQADIFAARILHLPVLYAFGPEWGAAADAACPEPDQLSIFDIDD